MMLYPTVQDLTNDKVNRYKLVIATAKCARHIIDKANEEQAFEDVNKNDNDRFFKDSKAENPLLEEKPVSIAVQKLYEGEYTIITDNE